jgi:hypothetical protein
MESDCTRQTSCNNRGDCTPAGLCACDSGYTGIDCFSCSQGFTLSDHIYYNCTSTSLPLPLPYTTLPSCFSPFFLILALSVFFVDCTLNFFSMHISASFSLPLLPPSLILMLPTIIGYFTGINQCMGPNNCSKDAYCNNTIGGYNCTCKPGFGGNGVNCSCMSPLSLSSPAQSRNMTQFLS